MNAIDNQTIDLCAITDFVSKWLDTVVHTLSMGLHIHEFGSVLQVVTQYDVCQVQVVDGLYRALLNDSLQAE